MKTRRQTTGTFFHFYGSISLTLVFFARHGLKINAIKILVECVHRACDESKIWIFFRRLDSHRLVGDWFRDALESLRMAKSSRHRP